MTISLSAKWWQCMSIEVGWKHCLSSAVTQSQERFPDLRHDTRSGGWSWADKARKLHSSLPSTVLGCNAQPSCGQRMHLPCIIMPTTHFKCQTAMQQSCSRWHQICLNLDERSCDRFHLTGTWHCSCIRVSLILLRHGVKQFFFSSCIDDCFK